MNRSAYLTTGLAIKALSSLSRADIVVHGKENLHSGPTIFVMNHFTRVETLLLPYYIYSLTDRPVWSLASSVLFKGGLKRFFDMVGVVSTSDPKRDELIVKSLLTGEANWSIFPEGSMVKTKKIVEGSKYMIAHPNGMHEPHTGAAALALRTELYRNYLRDSALESPELLKQALGALGIESFDEISFEPTAIVPVNLTYYPIRAAENIALDIASKLMKDIPDRMVEEIMTEGTMLLSGVDIDIRFGKPILMEQYVESKWLKTDLQQDGITGYSVSSDLRDKMRSAAYKIMQRYMQDIYSMTTVNHEHLFASLLRMYPFKRIEERDFKRRVFYVSSVLGARKEGIDHLYLHKSMKEDQAHLLTDDRYSKYENFIALALEKKVVDKNENFLLRDRTKLSVPLGFHKGRIDNPIEVMANEVEPLVKLQSLFRSIAWQPVTLLKYTIVKYLVKREKERYEQDCSATEHSYSGKKVCGGAPFLLPALRRRVGLVLVHSYLAVPEEVKKLATFLRKKGIWVYALRLPGHGTSAEDLATRNYREWIEAVETGYVLMRALCDRVIVGGVSVGGNLALDLAGRVKAVDGVFAICPPLELSDYSTKFMPSRDVWQRLMGRLKKEERKNEFLDFTSGNLHVNYPINPVAGMKEVGEYLESIEKGYGEVKQPALVIQADKNPVVNPEGSKKLYDALGSVNKEFCLLSYNRHVLVNGARSDLVFRKIYDFIKANTCGVTGIESGAQDEGQENALQV